MTGRTLAGQVALIEDDYTLIINRGGEAGVVPGMVFAVYSVAAQVVTDPESGRELGRINREKLRVRVFDVQPLFSRAHTFVRTDDFHGLLGLSFGTEPYDGTVGDVVTVDVGDAVELVSAETRTLLAGWPDR
ncbi:hypothetical protein A5757_18660 [Mycobacterium sp. 852013-51886_SCH5428379]|uniref:hypothetical protein n=1 Tax=Mycobacterium sp. 852013-51886_SCH5428379 TaxID=1834111 RepID=UPI0007FBABD4|nr:hypothetical protein [Mycobacterium sp. 852013-51886_SCH5428379]OBB57848.1 hypothetical protein A5757_18660 [Mycobacterium sp. 852013-51886_SCH5428379]